MSEKATNVTSCTRTTTCQAMGERVQGVNMQAKGLTFLEVVRLVSMTTERRGILYKSSPRDKGILLNMCPWCGGDLRWWGHGDGE